MEGKREVQHKETDIHATTSQAQAKEGCQQSCKYTGAADQVLPQSQNNMVLPVTVSTSAPFGHHMLLCVRRYNKTKMVFINVFIWYNFPFVI